MVNYLELAAQVKDAYFNTTLDSLNDHAVKMSVMTTPYQWHYHPNSDETFIGVEGILVIETPDQTFELAPGSLVTIPMNVHHRTRPKGERSVNLTIEKIDIETVMLNNSL